MSHYHLSSFWACPGKATNANGRTERKHHQHSKSTTTMTSKCEMGNHLKFFCHCITCAISLSEALLALFKLSMRKVFILKWLVKFLDFNVLSTTQNKSGWITNKKNIFLNLTVQSKIQITTQVCLIHCYTVESQPFSHRSTYLSMRNNTCYGTYFTFSIYILGTHHGNWLN